MVDAFAVGTSDTVTLSVTHGKLALGSTSGSIRSRLVPNNAASMTIWGTLANLNAALRGLVFTIQRQAICSGALAITVKNAHDNLMGSANVGHGQRHRQSLVRRVSSLAEHVADVLVRQQQRDQRRGRIRHSDRTR